MSVKVTLDNAQGGGPQIVITEDGIIQKKIWLRDERSPDKGIYVSEGVTTRVPLDAFPIEDGLVLYES